MANVKRLTSAAWTADQVFVSATGAAEGVTVEGVTVEGVTVEGVTVENAGSEPLVSLHYSGPNAQPSAPNVRDHNPC